MTKKKYRLAETRLPGGKIVKRPWEPKELLQLYIRGWKDGAAGHAMNFEYYKDVPEYDTGYKDGYDAKALAYRTAMKRLKHTPNILRLAEEDRDGTRQRRRRTTQRRSAAH